MYTEELIEAKKLIDKPRKWAKGSGQEKYWFFFNCYCAYLACRVIESRHDLEPYCLAEALSREIKPISEAACVSRITIFNDNPETTHADVMAMFDKAIEASHWEFTTEYL